MIRISSTIEINKPIEEVYKYISTPSTWPEHMPATTETKPFYHDPLKKGEKVSEKVKIFGQEGWVHWTCRENNGRSKFIYDGISKEYGTHSTIIYELIEENNKTIFTRKSTASQEKFLLRIIEPLLRLFVSHEAKYIMNTVKKILEGRKE